MRVTIASDHGGLELKDFLVKYLKDIKLEVTDMGTYNNEPVDYPDYAKKVGENLNTSNVDFGILVCGTGIGISIAANKINGIRAALCHNIYTAKMSRLHNNANILVLGGRVIGKGLAVEIVDSFLHTKFEGGRHKRRVDKIHKMEENN